MFDLIIPDKFHRISVSKQKLPLQKDDDTEKQNFFLASTRSFQVGRLNGEIQPKNLRNIAVNFCRLFKLITTGFFQNVVFFFKLSVGQHLWCLTLSLSPVAHRYLYSTFHQQEGEKCFSFPGHFVRKDTPSLQHENFFRKFSSFSYLLSQK